MAGLFLFPRGPSVEIRLHFLSHSERKLLSCRHRAGGKQQSTGLLHLIVRISPSNEKSRKSKCSFCFFGPSVEILTRGLLNPIQARYQTSPHPDTQFTWLPAYISTSCQKKQAIFSKFPRIFSFISKPAVQIELKVQFIIPYRIKYQRLSGRCAPEKK